MGRSEFLNEIVKNYFKYNCDTAAEAIDITTDKLGVTDKEFIEWFGRGRNEQEVHTGSRKIH